MNGGVSERLCSAGENRDRPRFSDFVNPKLTHGAPPADGRAPLNHRYERHVLTSVQMSGIVLKYLSF